jgi:hypothetical protein
VRGGKDLDYENLSVVRRELAAAHQAFSQFEIAETTSSVMSSWEDFLSSFGRALGKLIMLGMQDQRSAAIAYQLKNASQKDDEGLVYLREARNVREHGLEPPSTYFHSYTSVAGGAIAVSGNSTNIVLRGNTVNGKPVGDFVLNTKEGKPTILSGKPIAPVKFVPASVRLKKITNPEKKTKVFTPPQTVFGQAVDRGNPISLSRHALKGLDEKFDQIIQAITF